MSGAKRGKKVRAVPIGIGILAFVLAFGAGVVSKFAVKPAWARQYAVTWNDALGTLQSDLPYGDGEANKFDLYLPKDGTKGAPTDWSSIFTRAASPAATRRATGTPSPGCAARAMWRRASTTPCAPTPIPQAF